MPLYDLSAQTADSALADLVACTELTAAYAAAHPGEQIACRVVLLLPEPVTDSHPAPSPGRNSE